MRDLKRENVEVFEIIFNMIMKLFLGVSAIVALFIIVWALLHSATEYDKKVYAILTSVITGIIVLPFQHYFPISFGRKKAAAGKKIAP